MPIKCYGNKWAELTKFLPGRTDNANKESLETVQLKKKKLDSYMASGLLAQFQGLPCVNHTNQSTPISSSTQFSGDDSIHKDVAEIEETSECSQGGSKKSIKSYVGSDTLTQMLTSEDDCSKMTQPPDGAPDSLLYQQPNCEIPFADNSNSNYSEFVGTASYQLPSGTFDGESHQYNGLSVGNQELPGLTYTNGSGNTHFFNDQNGAGSQDQTKDPLETISTDAIASGQHEYSPLGIRQLMMTSMNCFSPCRLWDSPSLYDSPEDVLKSAAKTFTCTPSILKKRNRDLSSPLSEKRCGKKLDRVSFFSSAKDPSQSQVMLDENKSQLLPSSTQTADSGPFIEDKENLDPTEEIAQKEDGKSTPVKVKQSPVLVEQNLDDQFFLTDKVATMSATPKSPHTGKTSSVILETTVDPLNVTPSSCANPCQSLVSPHTVSAKRKKAASRFAVDFTVVNDAFTENSGMLGETPLRKGLESPSAWKSPWFSFLPGPRVDTDITIEDIGYFTSPGERSYDALGLMKQLSEHTASAYANAQEVLGDETPDSILKRRFSEKGEKSQNVLIVNDLKNIMFAGDGNKYTIITGNRSVRGGSTTYSLVTVSKKKNKGCLIRKKKNIFLVVDLVVNDGVG
ncbi:hypothetical protein OSB04_019376 [Centaurea solstitialis]|uniref:Uncharacterized protein n=1 Tax=Centaurea solstitialis TaxID=347529 RepID=A0AA38T9R2_9ASTR|nr:hypothetical protein OSB04_019376 [Centaurea solstitialis]